MIPPGSRVRLPGGSGDGFVVLASRGLMSHPVELHPLARSYIGRHPPRLPHVQAVLVAGSIELRYSLRTIATTFLARFSAFDVLSFVALTSAQGLVAPIPRLFSGPLPLTFAG